MTFAQGLPLRAKEPFGLEHFLLRKEEKMSPVVRIAKFALNGSILFILMMCTAWLAITIHLFVVYGLLESLTFALGSIYLFVLVFSMIYHDRP